MSALRRKMERYVANGAHLGWLLLCQERAVEIWRAGQLGWAEWIGFNSGVGGTRLCGQGFQIRPATGRITPAQPA